MSYVENATNLRHTSSLIFPNTQIAQYAIVSKSKGTNADVLTGNMDHQTHYLNPRILEIP